jgi:hypothetical protein
MEREYNDFSSKFYKIRSEFDSERFKIYQMCYNEIVEIIKENVMGNDEERICLDDDSIGIMKKDSDECVIDYYITSIGCKVESDVVKITLYCNEGEPDEFDWELDDCDDIEILIQVYDIVYDYFDSEDAED